MTDISTEQALRAKIDLIARLIREVREYKAAHPEIATGYYLNSYGSLLNAYREGDLGFDECVTLLGQVDTSKRVSDDAICDDVDSICPLVSELTAYQANVFLILNDGRAGLRFRDEEALNLITQHRKLIEDHERRRFSPFATAKAIIEAETCPDIRERADVARLDWLKAQSKGYGNGWIVRRRSEGGIALHESQRDNATATGPREAIDEAMKEGS